MCQTRSPAIVEDAEIFTLLGPMARQKQVAVSFRIPTNIRKFQRQIEHGGASPERRLDIMARLKTAWIFVSAAVSPLMPYGTEFARSLIDCAHHASVQALRPAGIGSATPRHVLAEIHRSIPGYPRLEGKLVNQLRSLYASEQFPWGVGNKGFIGAFLAARRFYGPSTDTNSAQLSLGRGASSTGV